MTIRTAGRTLQQIPVAQGAAGNTDLVAAPGAGMRVFIVDFFLVLDAAGSLKFTEGTGPTDLTGAMPAGLNGQLACQNDGETPVLETKTANAKLSIVTVTGKAFGWVRYFVAPE